MGICYNLFPDAWNDGACGTKWKPQDWPMSLMHSNHNQTWKNMINPHKEKCAHESFYGKMPDYAEYIRTLGEMGVVQSITMVK